MWLVHGNLWVIPAVLLTSGNLCHWMKQYLFSLIKTGLLLFASVLWLHCLQSLKDFRRQEGGALPAAVWQHPAVTGFCWAGCFTLCVSRQVRERDYDSTGESERHKVVIGLKDKNHVVVYWLSLIWERWGRLHLSKLWKRVIASHWRGNIYQCFWWPCLWGQLFDGVVIGQVTSRRKQGQRQRQKPQGGQRSFL